MTMEKKNEIGGFTRYIFNFDSVSEIVSFVADWNHPENKNCQAQSRYMTERMKKNDNKNIDDVGKDMYKPVLKLAGTLKCADEGLCDDIGIDVPMPRRRRVRRLESGDDIDIDRYLMRGRTDIWEEMRKENKPNRVIRIFVNMSISWDHNSESFKWRTSAIVALARVLEDSKIPFEVIGVFTASDPVYKKRAFFETRFVIKRSDQFLDIETIAYCAGSQAFTRVVCLGAIVKEADVVGHEVRGALGHPSDSISGYDPENDHVVSRYTTTQADCENELKRFTTWLANGNKKGE